MYLAFCGANCESLFFAKKPEIQPRQGKRQERPDLVRLFDPTKMAVALLKPGQSGLPDQPGQSGQPGHSGGVKKRAKRMRNEDSIVLEDGAAAAAAADDAVGDEEGKDDGSPTKRRSLRRRSSEESVYLDADGPSTQASIGKNHTLFLLPHA